MPLVLASFITGAMSEYEQVGLGMFTLSKFLSKNNGNFALYLCYPTHYGHLGLMQHK